MNVENRPFQHAYGRYGIDSLPEQMTGIEIATDKRPGDRAQLQHRLRTVDHKSRMHFDGDLHAVILSEFCVLDPIRSDYFVPLPIEHLQIFRWPRTRHPVRRGSVRRIAGTTGKIDDHGDAKFFRKPDGLATHRSVLLRMRCIRMQGIAVRTQSADMRAMVGEHLLKFREGATIVQHRQFAVRITRIISGAKFYGIDAQRGKFPENVRQRKLREQRGKHSNTHGGYYLLTPPHDNA